MEALSDMLEHAYNENYEEEYGSRVFVQNVPPGCRDEAEAERYARGCLWARAERAKVEAKWEESIEPVKRYLEDLERRRDNELRTVDDRYAYFEESLKAYASEVLSPEKGKPASTMLTSGVTLKIQRGREVVEIEDEEAFCLVHDGLVKVKTTPDKKAVLAALKAGEEIEGTRLITNTDTFSVEMPK